MDSNTFRKITSCKDKSRLISKITQKKERDVNDPSQFFGKIINENKKTGVRITNSNNEYKNDPFNYDILAKPKETLNQVSYNNTFFEKLDLNIHNYSHEDLFKLFGIKSRNLTQDIMKECKKIANKTHPDKSKLHEKYFIFFSTAYNKLVDIYTFNNKMLQKQTETDDFVDADNNAILNSILEKKKEPKDFNNWFNEQFEKHRVDNPTETGYDTWLKSDEDIIFTPQNINKDQMAIEMNKYKNQVKTVSKYNGIQSANSGYSGYSLIERDNFTSNGLFDNNLIYTDLKQAYAESVIPITEEDFNKVPKFNSVDEYKSHRDRNMVEPIDEKSAMEILYFEEQQQNEENVALAFYYATQAEKVKKQNDMFWAGLKKIAN
jgi:hypothetical protein